MISYHGTKKAARQRAESCLGGSNYAEAWFDPRVPNSDICVLRNLVDQRSEGSADQIFAKFADCGEWTFRRLREITRSSAAALQALGIRQGDHVLSWLPNGRDALRVWFGLNYIGAVYVPINLAYRGRLLEHVIANSDARLMVAHGDLVGRLADIDCALLERVVVVGGSPEPVSGIAILAADALDGDPDAVRPLERPIQPWDTQSIIYTSGTTGPSKGVLSSGTVRLTGVGVGC